ncbi:MAG: hypothetical protein ABR584_08785 [Candidatus Baltobacteraceae bacterium]
MPRLHVPSFSLRADTLHPQIEKPFHLIISAHFKEQLKAVYFMVLPNLTELELMGSERHTLSAKTGTDYSETLTVIAHRSGKMHLDPAYFDAIDGRDGKPKRFSTNDLVLMVEGGALEDPFAGLRYVLVTVAKMFAILVAVFVVATIFFRRRAVQVMAVPQPQAVVLPTPVPVWSSRDVLREQLSVLGANRSRGSVMQVRKTLWAMAGASEGETLADVLGRLQGRSPELQPLLRLTERAAFVADAYLQGAIDDMILGLQQYLA